MKKNKYNGYLIVISILLFLVFLFLIPSFLSKEKELDVHWKLNQPEYLLSDTISIITLKRALQDAEVHTDSIVIAQAILETGNFKSWTFLKRNNLFGIIDNKETKRQKKWVSKNYKHWYESILDYKKIQSRYKEGEDYYSFLKRINYAEDPLYNDKLQKIIKKWKIP